MSVADKQSSTDLTSVEKYEYSYLTQTALKEAMKNGHLSRTTSHS
jgi:hypothetical protein